MEELAGCSRALTAGLLGIAGIVVVWYHLIGGTGMERWAAVCAGSLMISAASAMLQDAE